ncbi:MAG: tRNA pseudouridine(13) synthase TruD [Candidatus Nezhaarchaeales archaeon]
MEMILESKSELDKFLGIEVYGTSTRGIGGAIRRRLEDFVVEEVPLQGGTSGDLTLLVIEKRGIDTLTAAIKLSRKLGIPLKHVGFAGLKDTRSISRQRFTLKIPENFDISKISDNKLKVLAVYRAKKHLRPGMLFGNSFTITIRGLEVPAKDAEALIRDALLQLNELGGVPNFYGYQRFGINRPNTHIVGKLLLQGEYEKAVMEILATPYPNEPKPHRDARAFLAETLDFKRALKSFPRSLIFERQMIKWLVDRPNDYLGSLRGLPKYVIALYVDAYLSYIFNRALSERFRKLRSLERVMEGDIIATCDAYGNPMRPTFVAKSSSMNLGSNQLILAFVPASVKVRPEGYMIELVLSFLNKEGLEPPFKRLEELGLQNRLGLLRQIAFKPINLSYNVEGDEVLKMSFLLPKSSYATILLREFIKPEDPIAAGF